MKRKAPAWLILTLVTLVAALCLGGTYEITKDTIAKRSVENKIATQKQLLEAANDFESVYAQNDDGSQGEELMVIGKAADGSTAGYVSTTTVQGFGGDVDVTVGVDDKGVITGVRVGGDNFSETAGLGAKSKEPAFYEQFAGKEYPVDLKKNGGEIDAITSATITSSAVVRGVNKAIKEMSERAGFKINEPVVLVEELGNDRYSTSKQGFGGPVYVELEVKDGSITDIVLGDENFNESAGYGAKAKDESFYKQYIGKGGTELALGTDVDAISGATITSTAVNDAVNMILLYVNDPAAFAAQTADAANAPDLSLKDGSQVYTAEGKGLTGTFDVSVSIDGSGAVDGIQIGDASTAEDSAFLGRVQNDSAFLSQFIGVNAQVDESAVDTVAGATISSKGVISAVNKAYREYAGIPEATPEPAQPAGTESGNTVKAKGLTGSFDVNVTLNDDGTVKAVTLGESDSSDDKYFLGTVNTDAFLGQFA
ncbi:MAG: RnfABCDGE type electron transport complex subunit G, partial [Clostridia bacterium]|nr:RnfABCDGE type electron transport complex subunit G [Clostridia bacterium]